jgi:phosphomannomutase
VRRPSSCWLRGEEAKLRDAFRERLAFGTAGMRGAMGAGPNRMNRLLVRKVSAGLARHLLAQDPAAVERGVVIGYDARRNSQTFALEAAAALSERGIPVWMFGDIVPTPVCSYATVALGASAGVMITASHNPPEDNGYKVFRANGAQIIEPDDSLISAAIDGEDGPRADVVGSISAVPGVVLDAYHGAIQALRVHPAEGARIVYTAMHGVGTRFCAAGRWPTPATTMSTSWRSRSSPTAPSPQCASRTRRSLAHSIWRWRSGGRSTPT